MSTKTTDSLTVVTSLSEKSTNGHSNIEMPDSLPKSRCNNYVISGSENHIHSDNVIYKIHDTVSKTIDKYASVIKSISIGIISILYAIFLGTALNHDFSQATPLAIFSLIIACGLVHFKILKPYFGASFQERVGDLFLQACDNFWQLKLIRWSIYGLITAGILAFLIIDTAGNRYRLMSLVGLAFFVIVCFIFSTNPSQIRWRPVIVGISLQFIFGILVLRWPPGYWALETVANGTISFLDYAQYGTRFVYGYAAEPPKICGMSPIFAFTAIQTLLYFGSILAALYYFGVIQFVLYQMAWLMQCTLGTTAAESLNAAGCIFLGMTEGPLMIRPYFSKMTKSELHTVFASGFACVAGSLFIAYISFGACPVYLLSACVMSAPASIAVSKLLLPETEESQLKKSSDLHLPPSEDVNVIQAISQGCSNVIDVIIQIIANLIVFVALLTFVDHASSYFFNLIGWQMNFQNILGYIFFPLAFLMGASDAEDWGTRMNETMVVAQLMGTKTVINEFIAYKNMGEFVSQNLIQGRAEMMATFALCGFSNFASIGIQLATIGSICPEKKAAVSEVIVRALVSGSISCFMTACVAGVLVDQPLICHPIASSLNCTDLSKLVS